MTKQEMLDKLGVSEIEWNSYVNKTSKFVNEVLDDGERELHKRILINITHTVDPAGLGELYETQKSLAEGVFGLNNVCGESPQQGEIKK